MVNLEIYNLKNTSTFLSNLIFDKFYGLNYENENIKNLLLKLSNYLYSNDYDLYKSFNDEKISLKLYSYFMICILLNKYYNVDNLLSNEEIYKFQNNIKYHNDGCVICLDENDIPIKLLEFFNMYHFTS